MRFVHLSDLHLGKKVHEYSLFEDQQYILKEILNIIDREKPDGVILAGDIYDKSVPVTDAVGLFDGFLSDLADRKLQVFIVSGNHDSADRLAFGSKIFSQSGIHLSPVYNGEVSPIKMTDKYGNLNVYLLPFIKPSTVRHLFEDTELKNYTDAVRCAVEKMNVDPNARNVLVSHQYVTCGERDENVGGTDNVDVSAYDIFDYVALGHLHGPHFIKDEKIRYCGSPLKSSFSEVNQDKSLTIVDFGPKGDVKISVVPLVPRREMREIKGTYEELTKKSFYENTNLPDDYLHITLTDEDGVVDAFYKLTTIYKKLMLLDYDNSRTREQKEIEGALDVDQKSPLELFDEFFEKQNNRFMDTEEKALAAKMIEAVWEVDL